MALRKLESKNYGGKWPAIIRYQNLHSFNKGLILLCQSILETRRITHLHGSAHFTIPLIKLQAEACNSIKKRDWYRFFPVNFGKFLRTAFFIEHLRWLLLSSHKPPRPRATIKAKIKNFTNIVFYSNSLPSYSKKQPSMSILE